MKRILSILILMVMGTCAHAQKRTYEYDDLNQLSRVNVYNGDTIQYSILYTYDELGNRKSKVISTTSSGVNDVFLSQVNVTPTTGVQPNQSVQVQGVVNQWKATAQPDFLIQYYISADAQWDQGDVLLSQQTTVANFNQLTQSFSTSVTLPNSLPAQFYLIAWVDASNVIPNESDEQNNFATVLLSRQVNCTPLLISILTTPSAANAATGSVSALVEGGTSPYTFVWNTGATSSSLSNLPAGTYSVQVTDSQGCLGQNTGIVGTTSTECALTVSPTIVATTCGEANGSIQLQISGGTSPYTFSWSHGPTTPSLSQLAQGTYTITVTDALGCQKVETYVVGSSEVASWAFDKAVALPVGVNLEPGNFGRIQSKYMLVSSQRNIQEYSFSDDQFRQIPISNFIPIHPNHEINRLSIFNNAQPSTSDKIAFSLIEKPLSGHEHYLYGMSGSYSIDYFNRLQTPSQSGPTSFRSLAHGSNVTLGIDSDAKLWRMDYNGQILGSETQPQISYHAYSLRNHTRSQVFSLSSTQDRWVKFFNASGQETSVLNCQTITKVTGVHGTLNRIFIVGLDDQLRGFVEEYTLSPISFIRTIPLSETPNNVPVTSTPETVATSLFIPLAQHIEVISLGDLTKTEKVSVGSTIRDMAYDESTGKLAILTSQGLRIYKKSSPSQLTVTGTVTDTPVGQSMGSINLTVSSPHVVFSWSNGSTAQNLQNLAAGTYTVTVTPNGGGCPVSQSFQVRTLLSAPVISASGTQVCSGQSVVLTATNCAATIRWSSGETGASITKTITSLSSFSAICESNGQQSSSSNVISISLIPNGIPVSAVLSGSQTIQQGGTANLQVAIQGTLPAQLVFNNASLTLNQTPSIIPVNPATTTTYSLTSISNTCGAGTVSGNATVTVTIPPTNPCPPTLTQGRENVGTGVYQAAQTISSAGNVATATTFKAGGSITLSPGFEAGPNEVFSASIEGCPQAVIPTNGLVAYYGFDGNSNDDSGNNNHLITTGTTSSVADRKNQALKAAGYGGNTSVGYQSASNSSSLQFTTGFSISLWYRLPTYAGMDGFRRQNANGYQIFVAKEGDRSGFYIGVSNDVANNRQSINFTNNPSSGANNFNITASPDGTAENNLNRWIHLVVTAGDGNVKIFMDGVLKNAASVASFNFSGINSKDLYLGTMQALGTYWYPFGGALDEVRIYNRGITDAEVKSLYDAEKP
ncbi:MAG: LamG-like jellyroll fold domain-containing protein [Spirosomataceae bacterium]